MGPALGSEAQPFSSTAPPYSPVRSDRFALFKSQPAGVAACARGACAGLAHARWGGGAAWEARVLGCQWSQGCAPTAFSVSVAQVKPPLPSLHAGMGALEASWLWLIGLGAGPSCYPYVKWGRGAEAFAYAAISSGSAKLLWDRKSCRSHSKVVPEQHHAPTPVAWLAARSCRLRSSTPLWDAASPWPCRARCLVSPVGF